MVGRDRLRALVSVAFLAVSVPASAKGAEPNAPVPIGTPGDWASSNDYPSTALRSGSEGVSRFSVKIDREGHVTDCQITTSSGSSDLDATTCMLVTKRGQFTPATDKQGRKTEGTWSSAIRWAIPKNVKTESRPLGISVQEFTFIVETDGKITDCKVLQQQTFGNFPSPDLCTDPQMQSRNPVRDASGHPVRKRVTIKNTTTAEMTLTTTISDP